MAEVYLSTHPTLKTRVLLKKLTLKNNPENKKRFRQEAIMMMELRHGNIVSVYDHFTEGRSDFLVQEYIEGASLEEVISRYAPMDPPLVSLIGQRISEALEHVHARGIIHRDVKPSNILIGLDGAVKITDFGIAARAEDPQGEGDRIVGTPSYMAPEQLTRPGRPVPASDLFGLGASLYEAATGKTVYGDGELKDILPRIRKGPSPDWSLVRDPSLRSLLKGLLRKSVLLRLKKGGAAAARFARNLSGRDRGDIEAALSEMARTAGGTKKKGKHPPAPAPVRKNAAARVLPLLLGLFSAAILVGGAFYGREQYDRHYGAFRVLIPVEEGAAGSVIRHGVLTLEPEGRKLQLKAVEGENLLATGIVRSRSGPRTLSFRYQESLASVSVLLLPVVIPGRGRGDPDLIRFETILLNRITFVPRFKIMDSLSGKKPEGVTLTLSEGGKPVPAGTPLTAGSLYTLHAEAPGYRPRELVLDTQPGCRELSVTVRLTPEPVRLRLVNEKEGPLAWKINGSDDWLQASEPPVTRRIPRIKVPGTLEMDLYPGWITVGAEGEGLSVQEDLLLEAGKIIEIRLTAEGRLVIPRDKEELPGSPSP
jgi:serine/threonine-protein kinase